MQPLGENASAHIAASEAISPTSTEAPNLLVGVSGEAK